MSDFVPVFDPLANMRVIDPADDEVKYTDYKIDFNDRDALTILNEKINEIMKNEALTSEEKRKVIRDLLFLAVRMRNKTYLHKKPVPEALDLEELHSVWSNTDHIYTKLYHAMGYITAGRVSEVTNIRPRDIRLSLVDYGGEERHVVIFNMINRKSKRFPFKLVPAVAKTPYERDYLRYIFDYAQDFPSGKRLLPFSRQVLNKWLNEFQSHPTVRYVQIKLLFNAKKGEIGIKRRVFSGKIHWHTHYFRACRLTHLAPLGENILMMIAGWSTTKPAVYYMRFNWEMVVERMLQSSLLGSKKLNQTTLDIKSIKITDVDKLGHRKEEILDIRDV